MSRTIEDTDGYVITVLDLYHRTTLNAARSILHTGSFTSNCHDRDHAYFTSDTDGQHSRQYGEAIVHVEVPTWAAIKDESYLDGETFYRVPLSELRSAQVLGAFTLTPEGARSPLRQSTRAQLARTITTQAATLREQAPAPAQTAPHHSRER